MCVYLSYVGGAEFSHRPAKHRARAALMRLKIRGGLFHAGFCRRGVRPQNPQSYHFTTAA